MTGGPAAAAHLAELDARYEAHVAELRRRARAAKESVSATAMPAPRPAPRDERNDHFIPETVPSAVDDDGIPLWEDPA